MKPILTLILFAMVLTACKNESTVFAKEHKTIKTDSPKKIGTKQQWSDTLVVDKRCAVNYWAPKEKMDKMKKDGGDGFYTASDDVGWYIYESTRYLDSIKFPIIRTKGYRYIRFKKADGSSEYINTDTIQGIAHIYFFDPHKTVIKADITNIYESFPEYFTPSE